MPIPIVCPGCSTRFKAPDQLAGRAASCPKCQAKLQIPALAVATSLPQATALPVATAIPTAKPPLHISRPVNAPPPSSSAVPVTAAQPNAPPADQAAAQKESIFKKRWTIDKILINVIAVIVFIWFMKGIVTEVLFKGLAENQQVQPKK